jgi:hypothetical protein
MKDVMHANDGVFTIGVNVALRRITNEPKSMVSCDELAYVGVSWRAMGSPLNGAGL